ncbi:hypothetical protein MP228_011094 [Amoeboaphelidium protococcarum]|nr:hypothetical protein MP228_011094 [Amoeboaphelidium protococcarum]
MTDNQPQIVRLLDSTGLTVLDSIDCEYEDSFCLETFGDLITQAEEVEPKGSKHFIIARVQTWDHKQPGRAFYSYYHAHHLNKLLFQTQVYLDKKLIHRLHVMNPLTNTDIIGNVLYFIVVGRSDNEMAGAVTAAKKQSMGSKNDNGIKATAAIESASSPPSDQGSTTRPKVTIKVDTAVNSRGDSSKPKLNFIAHPPTPSVSRMPPLQNDTAMLNRAFHHQLPVLDEDEDADDGYAQGGSVGGDNLNGSEYDSAPQSPAKSILFEKLQSPLELANNGWTLKGTVTSEVGAKEQLMVEKLPSPSIRSAYGTRQNPFSAYPSSPLRAEFGAGAATSGGKKASRRTSSQALKGAIDKQIKGAKGFNQLQESSSKLIESLQLQQDNSGSQETQQKQNQPSGSGVKFDVPSNTKAGDSNIKGGKRIPVNLTVSTALNVNVSSGPKTADVNGLKQRRRQNAPITPSPFRPPLSAFPYLDERVQNKLAAIVPTGQITQRGAPLTPVQALAVIPPSSKQRRRQLSFMNSVESSGSFNATIEDWQKMKSQEQRPKINTRNDQLVQIQISSARSDDVEDDDNDNGVEDLHSRSGKYDEVKPFGGLNIVAVEDVDSLSRTQQDQTINQQKGDVVSFDAVLLATDGDFLEQSRIRAIFRENAVHQQDAVLFEMPPFTGDDNNDGVTNALRGNRLLTDEGVIPCDFCFPTDQQLNHPNPYLRVFHQLKCYFLIIVLTAAIVGFIYLVANRSSPPSGS